MYTHPNELSINNNFTNSFFLQHRSKCWSFPNLNQRHSCTWHFADCFTNYILYTKSIFLILTKVLLLVRRESNLVWGFISAVFHSVEQAWETVTKQKWLKRIKYLDYISWVFHKLLWCCVVWAAKRLATGVLLFHVRLNTHAYTGYIYVHTYRRDVFPVLNAPFSTTHEHV